MVTYEFEIVVAGQTQNSLREALEGYGERGFRIVHVEFIAGKYTIILEREICGACDESQEEKITKVKA
jgi:hypothetical protein